MIPRPTAMQIFAIIEKGAKYFKFLIQLRKIMGRSKSAM